MRRGKRKGTEEEENGLAQKGLLKGEDPPGWHHAEKTRMKREKNQAGLSGSCLESQCFERPRREDCLTQEFQTSQGNRADPISTKVNKISQP